MQSALKGSFIRPSSKPQVGSTDTCLGLIIYRCSLFCLICPHILNYRRIQNLSDYPKKPHYREWTDSELSEIQSILMRQYWSQREKFRVLPTPAWMIEIQPDAVVEDRLTQKEHRTLHEFLSWNLKHITPRRVFDSWRESNISTEQFVAWWSQRETAFNLYAIAKTVRHGGRPDIQSLPRYIVQSYRAGFYTHDVCSEALFFCDLYLRYGDVKYFVEAKQYALSHDDEALEEMLRRWPQKSAIIEKVQSVFMNSKIGTDIQDIRINLEELFELI